MQQPPPTLKAWDTPVHKLMVLPDQESLGHTLDTLGILDHRGQSEQRNRLVKRIHQVKELRVKVQDILDIRQAALKRLKD